MTSQRDSISILVVDDVPDKLVAMQALLEDLGSVVAVRSGREALRALLHDDFAVILLDVNMPDMDGFETAALIRERKQSEGTPIIFVTADSDETHARRGYSLGAVDYILAPVIPEVLRAKVGVFVDLYRKNAQIKRQMEERVALAGEQAARAAAETATRRSAFLAEASNRLANSLDSEATVSTVLQLTVPAVADVVALATIDKRGKVQQTELAWMDAGTRTFERQSIQASALSAALAGLISEAAGRAKDRNCSRVESSAPLSLAIADGGPVSCESAIALPLVARGRTLGALVIGLSRSRPEIEFLHSLAEELAGRAAVAIDNARLYREIQIGDRRKDEFLAMLGHELRNPLAAMANAMECLRLSTNDGKLRGDAEAVLHRQLQQMTHLVDDLLDVSRITRGKIKLHKQPTDLAAAIRGAVATTAPIVAARRHDLQVSLPAAPLRLHADPTRIEQIIANLLHNAAKYTEPGGQIKLSADMHNDHVVVRVRDNGNGISPDLLPSVFELFTQGDRTLDRSQGGLGIGLTLVRSLVEMHGGEVGVASAGLQQGTEFVVRLPIERTAEPAASDPPPAEPAAECPVHRRVLLVDDNADLATTAAALLRGLGHDVQVAEDGFQALALAPRWKPDAVLIDIGLPGMNGYELAHQLRRLTAFERTLLVAITGYGQQEDRRRSAEAGFDCHLVKPVPLEKLQQVLTSPAEAQEKTFHFSAI